MQQVARILWAVFYLSTGVFFISHTWDDDEGGKKFDKHHKSLSSWSFSIQAEVWECKDGLIHVWCDKKEAVIYAQFCAPYSACPT